MTLQTEFTLDLQAKVAYGAGTSLERAAHLTLLLTDIRDLALAQEASERFFAPAGLPARSTVGVSELAVQGAVIEIDSILAAPGATREVISTPAAAMPPAESGCAQAVQVGSFIFLSSRAATDFQNGIAPAARVQPEFPHFDSIVKRQTQYILRAMGAVLAAAGSSLDHVVKTQVFLPSLKDFAELEAVWRDFFPADPPARSVIPASLAIPGSVVEVNAIAIVPDGHVHKEVVHTDAAPTPIIHEPQAIKAGNFVFLSQLMATDYQHGVAPAVQVNPAFPHHRNTAREQLGYVLENAETILQAAGSSIKHLVRRQTYYSSLKDDFAPSRDVMLTTFAPEPPVGMAIGVGTGLLVPGCHVLLDGIAVTK